MIDDKTFTGIINWGENTLKDMATEEYMCVISEDWNYI